MTSKVISNRIKERKSKSTGQYYCKLFFRLYGTCYLMVELSNSTGWGFDSTIKFNASTGEGHCDLFGLICLWCLWYWSQFRHKASWLHSFLSWFPWNQQAAVASLLWMEEILANTSLLLNRLSKKMISWSRTWIDILAPSFANWQKLLT